MNRGVWLAKEAGPRKTRRNNCHELIMKKIVSEIPEKNLSTVETWEQFLFN